MYRIIKKIMFQFQPESAHLIAESILANGAKYAPFLLSWGAKRFFVADERLTQNLLGTTFSNPVGLGAGFDKNATMLKGLVALGFGHIEFGTITPKAQEGNAKPRLFRFPKEESIQNAMGFNNDGLERVKQRVRENYPFITPLGANIGKNKLTASNSTLNDYKTLIAGIKELCDYIVINISSPNTPGLRDLQNEAFITELFEMAKELTTKPILLKIAPDMSIDTALGVSNSAIKSGASGIIATNTTVEYSLLPNAKDFGGISGKALQKKSKELFKELSKELFGKTTLISVGGIDSAQEAYERIVLGASLIQIYSAFIFKGPSLLKEINEGLLSFLDRDGFYHISEAIGAKL